MFTKKLQEFLEENKDITMIGFAWSLSWRMFLIVFAVSFVLNILADL